MKYKNILSEFYEWRIQLRDSISDLSAFLDDKNIPDIQFTQQINSALETLEEDELTIAFVGGSSRGKSELINAILYQQTGHSLLPSSSGRTTVCPTKISYNPEKKPHIKLLTTDSRSSEKSFDELQQDYSLWHEIEIDPSDPDNIAAALSATTKSRLVSIEYANSLNYQLLDKSSTTLGLKANEFDEVDIPKWRYAIINFPHPLLESGMVILDTPDPDSIGSEPELALQQIIDAHAIVYLISQNTGVTSSDLNIWENYLGAKVKRTNSDKTSDLNKVRQFMRDNQRKVVALNKIDTLWDGIRNSQEIEHEVTNQVQDAASALDIDPETIFAVSAQKGLLGRLQNNVDLLSQSRLEALESAIFERVVAQKQALVIEQIREPIDSVLQTTNNLLHDRNLDNQLHVDELEKLSLKNTEVISHIMSKASSEKVSLEEDMKHYQALRSVYHKETQRLLQTVSTNRLEILIARTKREINRCATSLTIPKIIAAFFDRIHEYLNEGKRNIDAAANLAETASLDYTNQLGISSFKIDRLDYNDIDDRITELEIEHRHLKKTKTMILQEQSSIAKEFNYSICANARIIFQEAVEETVTWTENLIIPIATRVREHHAQLRQRVESVKRIHEASDGLAIRLFELTSLQIELHEQLSAFSTIKNKINEVMRSSITENLQIAASNTKPQQHRPDKPKVVTMEQSKKIKQ